ncbi:sulfatase-like hydrolase/transferase [Methyloceanibacter sp.]|uniref:sulfatase-like hydrolase/transferase n=1 Tax=Methyloceanibacter sp. TaxID=1965321 RepID=UPI00351B75EF
MWGSVLGERAARIAPVACALALLAATFIFLFLTEPIAVRLYFATAVTAGMVFFLTALSRRLLFASVTAASLVAIVFLISVTKQATMHMGLHSYDLFFYLNSSTFEFLWGDYRRIVVSVLGACAAATVLTTAAWRFDMTRLPRLASILAVIVSVTVAGAFEPRATAESGAFRLFTQGNSHISAFYLSWGETWRTLRRGQLMAAAAGTPLPDFASESHCKTSGSSPHIVLLHQESLVPPALFPGLQYDRALDRFFLSGDQRLHRLRVEAYGGGSWVTEFALLTGISTKAFGDMRMFVQVLMEGRLNETLPQVLASCGYRTLMLFPMNNGFLRLDRFYRSIGFSEILDQTAQNAPTNRERDRFYFQNALDAMDLHLKSSKQPLFVYIQTMAAHGPYDRAYMPRENVPGGGPGTSAEMSEYLRRAGMAMRDGNFLMDEIKRRFPGEPVLVTRYGDHQPSATHDLVNDVWGDDSPDVGSSGAPGPFITFYAMEGLNYPVPPLPDFDPLDIAYLGTVLLEAAGLPLSGVQRERKRLMVVCAGRYSGCEPRSQIMAFHRRLINSGFVRTQ